jgi:hypothetical protein
MSTLTFFRQARVDGGIRTGVRVNGDLAWHHFDEPSSADLDPALLWYVDLRCEGASLPTEKEQARHWLIQNAPVIQEAFSALAEKLQVGYDDESWPYQFQVSAAPPDTSMKIVCSSIRGLELGDLAKAIRAIGENWVPYLRQLEPAVLAA